MILAIAAALGAVVALSLYLRARRQSEAAINDTTPAFDAWLLKALEDELAEAVLGIRGSSAEERRTLTRTLANDPDADVVGKIEEIVKAVELEFVRYAHEADVETTVRVRYEDGRSHATSRRFALGDVPEAALSDFKAKGSTRVFRTWSFPWQRMRVL